MFVHTRLVLLLLALFLSGIAPVGFGRDLAYPTKPIRLVVPYPAGSGTDTIARVVGQKLAERLGYTVVVDNRPGGASIIGLDLVAKANPDGYTILVGREGNAADYEYAKREGHAIVSGIRSLIRRPL